MRVGTICTDEEHYLIDERDIVRLQFVSKKDKSFV